MVSVVAFGIEELKCGSRVVVFFWVFFWLVKCLTQTDYFAEAIAFEWWLDLVILENLLLGVFGAVFRVEQPKCGFRDVFHMLPPISIFDSN